MEPKEKYKNIESMTIDEKCEYYKIELEKYRIKYSKLNEEYLRLKEDNQKILDNLNNEKKIRMNLEEKVKFIQISNQNKTFIEKSQNISLFDKLQFDEDDVESDENEEYIINNTKVNEDLKTINDINKDFVIVGHDNNQNEIKLNDDINDIKDEENNFNYNINLLINRNDIIDNNIIIEEKIKKNNETIINVNNNDIQDENINKANNELTLRKENFNNDIINNKIQENKVEENKIEENIDKNTKKDSNLEEDDEEKLLSKDLIFYRKDSISLRKDIAVNEKKTAKIYSLLKKWRHYIENLKKGVQYFNKSISLFNEHLATYNNDNDNNVLKEYPFILEQISILQKCFSSINIYCSSLIMTIDSSCSIQINDIITNNLHKLSKLRNNLNNKIINFIQIQNKYLNIKKNKKESKALKGKYYEEYKGIEEMKYKYCCMLNQMIMAIKLKIPEMISLLTYSYIVFFTNIKDELYESNQIVRKNLEIILNRVIIKKKIEKKIEEKEKNIVDKLFKNVDKTLKDKEGFLNVKDPEKGKIEKRYVKISNGHLIYYKLIRVNGNEVSNNIYNKKYLNMIDKIDSKESYEICNLLLSNVKKNVKEEGYPFCFEINNVNLKKAYKFQAETEYEMEEWISSITNAISDQIIGFDGNNNKDNKKINLDNDKKNNSNNNLFSLSKDGLNSNKKIIITNLINENICSDCGAQKPTWLSLNWMTMICIECSSIHRSLGVHISKIRSLELDNIINEYLELLNIIRQTEINSILEEKISENEKPKFNSIREQKEFFIINKYSKKKYINKQIYEKEQNEVINEIFKSIEKNDLFNIFKLVKLNSIDINELYTTNEDEKIGFIHYCVKFDKINCLKLFYILGGDINLLDSKGQKAINLANKNEQKNIVNYLAEKENEKIK